MQRSSPSEIYGVREFGLSSNAGASPRDSAQILRLNAQKARQPQVIR